MKDGGATASEQARDGTVTPSSCTGAEQQQGGWRVEMRLIRSFWEGQEAKANVCHNVRLMHMSTSSLFFPAGCRLG